jgi:hypothetical protein
VTGRKNAIVVLIAVLLIGCLLGASGVWLWKQKSRSIPEMGARYMPHGYSDGFFERLQITPEQEKRLEAIFEESRAEINDCYGEMQKRMDAIRIRTNERIEEILDEKQKSIFESLVKEAYPPPGGGGRHGRGRMPPPLPDRSY